MKIGLCMFPTSETIGPVELARAAEERGFESLVFTEHTHIPVGSESDWPGGRGPLPDIYKGTYDPFVALTAAAAVTERILIGTGVCLVVERDPIITAKEVATLDRISRGRFLFGVGAGWNREEMQNHGTDPTTRMALLKDRILAMKAIWANDVPEYHGKFVDFDPMWCWPKPLQQPHPPVLVGGMGPGVEQRILDYGDEWMAMAVSEKNIGDFAQRVARLQAMAAEQDREPIPVSLFYPDPRMIDQLADVGVTRVFLGLQHGSEDDVLRRLDRHAELLP